MSAFGPYISKTVVDFEALGENGVYLITGDTGAGKTTIFDAITYALYNKTSGNRREPSMLRSKYVDGFTPTEVELTFTHNDKQYYVKRSLAYLRDRKKGGGTTTEKEKATLICPHKTVDGKDAVTSEIIEILGIDSEQFTQITMIAQGEFLKLLLASTENRRKIFQKIFYTQNYGILQEKIKLEYNTLNTKYKDIRANITASFKDIVCDENDVLSIEAKKAIEGKLTTEETLTLIEKLIENDELIRKKLDAETGEILSKSKAIVELLTKLDGWEKAEKSRKENSDELTLKSNELNQYNQQLKTALENQPEIDKLATQIAKIESQLPEYTEFSEKTLQKNNLATSIKANKENLSAKKQALEKQIEKIAYILQKREEFKDADVQKLEQETKKTSLVTDNKNYNSLKDDLTRLKQLQHERKSKQQEYLKASNIASEKIEIYNKNFKLYLDEQAGIIAEKLQDNEPCPVCGSTSHPKIALKAENAPTKEQLDKYKISAEIATNELTKLSEEGSKLKGLIEDKTKNLEENLSKLFDNISLDNAENLLSDKINSNNEQIKEIDEKIKIYQENIVHKNNIDEKYLPQAETVKANLEKDISQIETSIVKDSANLQAIDARLGELSAKLKHQTKKLAEAEKNKLLAQKNAFSSAIKTAEDIVNKTNLKIATLTSAIKEAEKQLADYEQIDKEAQHKKATELSNRQREISEIKEKISARKITNQKILKDVSQNLHTISEVEKKLSWLKALSDTANGTISGKEKIELEIYIQMLFFDRIINRANLRLLMMSNGQYELKRSREAEDNRNKAGLDLNIIDHINNTERNAKTLSGGESFLASLSLALGLADEIQASAGGIKIDTLFIDEGFGSLSENCLEQAVNALIKLSQENRLVGIISHVSDLQRRIDRQIKVTKDRNGGSKLQII